MTDSSLNLTYLQASVLASEIALAKNQSIRSVNLVTNLSRDVNDLKTSNISNTNDIALLTTKIKNLCNLLDIFDISSASDISYNLL